MLEHIRLMEEADLSFPIILSATGAVMDGMHRVAKAALLGRTETKPFNSLRILRQIMWAADLLSCRTDPAA